MSRILVALLFCVSAQAFAAVSEGNLAPNFKLPGLKNTETGAMVSLSDYKGKVVYLDFWASWCGPCRVSLPLLNDMYKELAPKGFEVVAVNIDETQADAVNFLTEYPVDYPVLADPEGSVPAVYEPKGMPTSYLIDRSGRVQIVHTGFKKGDLPAIRSKIETLLAQ
ncbi:TlpA disulfide reductase family protein [Agaribacterium haliotis]|uniref:TlpA disulfide reductase family protein n=1 Tax=Agaribacterium haliotis TaxID=2013869 RepID=UPI000BB59A24|nr:TlpA disulfide reductase family protein [Agaribacterium haliotis]